MRQVVGSIPIRGNEILNIFISLNWCRGKSGDEFRQSTRNASRIRLEVGYASVLEETECLLVSYIMQSRITEYLFLNIK